MFGDFDLLLSDQLFGRLFVRNENTWFEGTQGGAQYIHLFPTAGDENLVWNAHS